MSTESTSTDLLERLRDPGNQEAWRQFDERYRELILRFALRRGLQPADAEDVRQAVLLSLTRSFQGFVYRPDLGGFRDYLGTVIRNAVHRHLRGQELRPETLSSSAPEPVSNDQTAWDEEWQLHHYRRAMKTLRTTFHAESMAIFDDLLAGARPEDVAARHGTHVDNVYKVKQRVRDRLKELVSAQIEEEEFRERRG